MNKDRGKSSKPADKGKVKDLPSRKLSSDQESAVKGGRSSNPNAPKLGRDLTKGTR